VFWTAPPRSWRLMYLDGREWKEVQARGPYSATADALVTVEFASLTTAGLRLEVTIEGRGPVSLAEWAVGPDARLEPPDDLSVSETFDLAGGRWSGRFSSPTGRRVRSKSPTLRCRSRLPNEPARAARSIRRS
jgi:hypothetical protein